MFNVVTTGAIVVFDLSASKKSFTNYTSASSTASSVEKKIVNNHISHWHSDQTSKNWLLLVWTHKTISITFDSFATWIDYWHNLLRRTKGSALPHWLQSLNRIPGKMTMTVGTQRFWKQTANVFSQPRSQQYQIIMTLTNSQRLLRGNLSVTLRFNELLRKLL